MDRLLVQEELLGVLGSNSCENKRVNFIIRTGIMYALDFNGVTISCFVSEKSEGETKKQ